jgi:hypothetical protein
MSQLFSGEDAAYMADWDVSALPARSALQRPSTLRPTLPNHCRTKRTAENHPLRG